MSNHVYTSLRDFPTEGNIHDVRIRHRLDWKGDAEICWDLHFQPNEYERHVETKRVVVPGCILAAFLRKATAGAVEDLQVAIKTLQGIVGGDLK